MDGIPIMDQIWQILHLDSIIAGNRRIKIASFGDLYLIKFDSDLKENWPDDLSMASNFEVH